MGTRRGIKRYPHHARAQAAQKQVFFHETKPFLPFSNFRKKRQVQAQERNKEMRKFFLRYDMRFFLIHPAASVSVSRDAYCG